MTAVSSLVHELGPVGIGIAIGIAAGQPLLLRPHSGSQRREKKQRAPQQIGWDPSCLFNQEEKLTIGDVGIA
jgi:hypothetical protein